MIIDSVAFYIVFNIINVKSNYYRPLATNNYRLKALLVAVFWSAALRVICG